MKEKKIKSLVNEYQSGFSLDQAFYTDQDIFDFEWKHIWKRYWLFAGTITVEKRSKGKFSSTHSLLEAYRAGDSFAKEIWLKSVRQLAIGLASVANVISPEIIVLGGGITEAGKDLFDPLQEYMAIYEWRAGGNKVDIVKASFGDLAGAAGAASYAMSRA